MRIKEIWGNKPHPDHGGWRRFLDRQCELRDEHDGVKFYGAVNCNYILFPCGTLICNYGYHGKAVMHRIREEGATAVLSQMLKYRDEYVAWRKQIDKTYGKRGRNESRREQPTREGRSV